MVVVEVEVVNDRRLQVRKKEEKKKSRRKYMEAEEDEVWTR